MVQKIHGIIGIILVLGSIAVFTLNENNDDNKASGEPIVLRLKGTAGASALTAVDNGKLGVAIREGYLQEEMAKVNVKVELVPIATEGGSAAGEILGSNSVDIASWGEIPILHVIGSGIDVDIIAIEPFGGSRNAIMVLNGSDINSIKDLKGKKLAATYGGNAHLFWNYVLKKNGLSGKDITFVNLPKAEARDALFTKNIDVWVSAIPDAVKLEREGKVKIIYDVTQVPEWPGQGVTVVQRAYGKKYPQAVVAYLKAMIRANEWVKNHPKDYISNEANVSKVPRYGYERQYPKNEFIQTFSLTKNEIDKLNLSKQNLIELGLHKGDFDIPSRVDRTYLDSAIKELENEKQIK